MGRHLLCGVIAAFFFGAHAHSSELRIAVVHSYHSGYAWTEQVESGFLARLRRETPVEIVARSFLDAKRTPAQVPAKAAEAIGLLQSLRWDILFVTDDDAFFSVGESLLRQGRRVVVAGINDPLSEYVGSDQRILSTAPAGLSGVLENYAITPLGRLIKDLVPGVQRLTLLFDRSRTADGVYRTLVREMGDPTLPGARLGNLIIVRTVRSNRFADWRRAVERCGKGDALVLFPFSQVEDPRTRKPKPALETAAWVLSHSKVPEFASTSLTLNFGYFANVGINASEHGEDAAIAYLNSLQPNTSSNRMQTRNYARMRLNPTRAKELGLTIPFDFLSYSYALAGQVDSK